MGLWLAQFYCVGLGCSGPAEFQSKAWALDWFPYPADRQSRIDIIWMVRPRGTIRRSMGIGSWPWNTGPWRHPWRGRAAWRFTPRTMVATGDPTTDPPVGNDGG